MRIRPLAVTLLLIGAGIAHGEDAPSPPPAESGTATPPQAQSPAPKQSLERVPADSHIEKTSEPGERFSLRRVDGGFLRFDSQTGKVAYCNSQRGSWTCEAVPETRAALEKEVEQLRGEVSALQQKLKALDDPPRPPQPVPNPPQTTPPAASPPPPGKNGEMTSLPGSDQISRAAAAMQEAWRHFVELMIGLKNDMMRRS